MGYEKGIICTKKRFLHQKSERKEEKTQLCTEGPYQSSVVIKGCKTNLFKECAKIEDSTKRNVGIIFAIFLIGPVFLGECRGG